MKKSLIIFSLIVSFFSSSCNLTRAMWDKHYHETLSDFFVTRDGRQVIFLGDQYHYIFRDNSGIIKKLLFWENRQILFIDTSESYIMVNRDNKITGYVTIRSAFKKLINFDYNFLKSMGFIEDDDSMKITIKLSGIRYQAISNLQSSLSLNRKYDIEVRQEISKTGKVARATVTPIIMTIDASLWIGENILLAPFYD